MSRNERHLKAQKKNEDWFQQHLCHVPDCKEKVAPKFLMCSLHWYKVPRHIQDQVQKHFNPAQCAGKIRPSIEWLKAARAAINSVQPRLAVHMAVEKPNSFSGKFLDPLCGFELWNGGNMSEVLDEVTCPVCLNETTKMNFNAERVKP